MFSGLTQAYYTSTGVSGSCLCAHQAAHEAKSNGVVHRLGKAGLACQRLLLRPAGEALDGGAQVPAHRQGQAACNVRLYSGAERKLGALQNTELARLGAVLPGSMKGCEFAVQHS